MHRRFQIGRIQLPVSGQQDGNIIVYIIVVMMLFAALGAALVSIYTTSNLVAVIGDDAKQAGYLAVKFWARFYTPDVLLGAYTPDELHEAGAMKDINPVPQHTESGSKLLDKLKGKNKPSEPPQDDKTENVDDDTTEGEIVEPDEADEAEMRIADYRSAILHGDNLPQLANDIACDKLLSEGEKGLLMAEIKNRREVEA